MSRFRTLFSSSSGNCSLLMSGDSAVLFDCGKSAKLILARLAENGVEPDQVRAICITHEHSDHTSALPVLSGKLNCPVYASRKVASFLEEKGMVRGELRIADCCGFQAGEMYITPFPTPHDSVGSLGYRIRVGENRNVAVCTDLGWITPEVEKNLLGCNVVLLESNYDPDMLFHGPYSKILRERIDGLNGHLSNPDCASFLPKLVENGAGMILLGHLSHENNLPELARKTAEASLQKAGLQPTLDYRLEVCPRDEMSVCFGF